MTEPVPRSLHEHDFKHLEEKIEALKELLFEKINALESNVCSVDRRHTELAQLRDKAVDAALAAANEKDLAHNDVLGAMKDQSSTFVTKEQAAMQFKGLAIALAAIAALVAIIGAIVTWGSS